MDTHVESPLGEDSGDDEVVESTDTVEVIDEISKDSPLEDKEIHDVFALPIRAKPLFLNNGEDVVEFTLSESKDGLESASIIVGEGLFRVVETKMHQDGIPRIDLKMALDSEVTGFQHIVEKPTAIEMGVSGGLLLVGLILCFLPFSFTMILGIASFVFGVKFSPNYLERHRLVFSSCGSTHVHDINPLHVFKPTFRVSMALIGPTLAEYMKTGEIDSSSIDELHSSLRSPIPVHKPLQIAVPPQKEQLPVGPPGMVEIPVTSTAPIMEIATPNIQSQTPLEVKSGEEKSVVIPALQKSPTQQNSLPAPTTPPPTTPPPTTPPPTKPAPTTPPSPVIPQPNPLPPPPPVIPKPRPLPPPPVVVPSHQSMQRFDTASLPLDAPLPEAPRIPVAAAPQEQTISQEEQDALMDELL